MNRDDFSNFYSKLLVETEESDHSAPLFSMHNSDPPNQDQPPTSDQDQSPISEPPPVAPTQDQADDKGVDDTPFEEAVPLEDELASLLDDIAD